jgi:MFS family permease
MFFALGGVLGPAVGGVLVAEFGWRAVFWFRIPLALAPLTLLKMLPADAERTAGRPRYDAAGAALMALTLALLLLMLNQLHGQRGPSALALLLGAATLAAGAVFFWHEGRASDPLLRPGLFRSWRFTVSNVGNIVINLVGFSVLLLGPYFMVQHAGMTAITGGLLLAISAFGTAALAWLAGHAIARIDPHHLALAGGIATTSGLWLISGWTTDTPLLAMAAGLYLLGAGLGLYQVAYMEIVAAALPAGDRGVAGSLAMATRTIGLVTGASILTLLFDGHIADAQSAGLADGTAFMAGFRGTFRDAVAIIGIFLLVSLLRRRKRR